MFLTDLACLGLRCRRHLSEESIRDHAERSKERWEAHLVQHVDDDKVMAGDLWCVIVVLVPKKWCKRKESHTLCSRKVDRVAGATHGGRAAGDSRQSTIHFDLSCFT